MVDAFSSLEASTLATSSLFQNDEMEMEEKRDLFKRTVVILLLAIIYGIYATRPEETTAELAVAATMDAKQKQQEVIQSDCPCIATYLTEMRRLGIVNGHNMTYAEWESVLCQPPAKITDPRPIVIGVGPGTTATRSFAFAANLLGQTVLHFTLTRRALGRRNQPPDRKKASSLVKWLVKGENDAKIWNEVKDTDWVETLRHYHTIFDTPWGAYALDVLRAFPNAKFIMTHRDPEAWYDRRSEFCSHRGAGCAVPFLLRPLHLQMSVKQKNSKKFTYLTRQQVVEAFGATEEALKCMVGPDRFLLVDAWNPPQEGDWLEQMASFLNVSLPPPKSQCTAIPKRSTHQLTCGEDESCENCVQWLNKHPLWYESH